MTSTTACRARRRRCPGSRRTASSSGCARSGGPAGKGRHLVARQAVAPRCARTIRSSMSLARSSSGRRAGAWRRRVGLDRQVVDRQVRRREGQRLVEVGAAGRQADWPGSAYIRSMLKVSKAAGLATAARACAASCTRPMARSVASSKLCTPIDRRVTPAARKARKRSARRCRGWLPA
jgi:hypothetical protein